MPLDETYTGQDGTVVIQRGGETVELAVSNVTVDIETSTTEVQHNDGLTVTNVPTTTTISGSFEYEGINVELIRDVTNDGGDQLDKLTSVGSIVVREGDGTFSAEGEGTGGSARDRKIFLNGVQFTSVSRDVPSDDVASTSVDFVADEVNVKDGTE